MSRGEQRTAPTVLVAKLTPPAPRRTTVPRPGLVALLENAPPSALRSVVAPAGWGKSELIAQWIDVHRRPIAYLRLALA